MSIEPRQFRAKAVKDGRWVQGWYAMQHIHHTDNHDNLLGYDTVPSIFNDEPGKRGNGGYWTTIDPATLVAVEEQLSFDL